MVVIGNPSFRIGQVVAAGGEDEDTLTIHEILRDTESGRALYVASFAGEDETAGEVLLMESEVTAFQQQGGRPRGAPEAAP